jgi:hypothetical protein
MYECITGLKQIARKYKTCIENNLDFRLSDRDLGILKKSIYYLSLIDSLVKEWNKEKQEKGVK